MICKVCGVDCTRRHYMCDQAPDFDTAWCDECFLKSPCGRGEHGESCATLVMDCDELPASSPQPPDTQR